MPIHRYMTRSRCRAERAVRAIQRAFIRTRSLLDPITRETVRFPIFTHITEQRHETVYSARVLATYIQASGSALDPSTRIPFNAVELARLSRVSGVDVRNMEALEETRRDFVETESLRAWLLNDIEENIASLRAFDTMSTRRMLSTVFPSLIVNVVRFVRNCQEDQYESTAETLFNSINTMVSMLESEHAGNLSFRTMLMIFRQFLWDLRMHVDSRTLLSGSAANINIGGMTISMNLQDI